MRQRYEEKHFTKKTQEIIDQANAIIEEYQGHGFALSLRQLYYRFVARGLLANEKSEYEKLGSVVRDGKMAGLIDWDAVEDRTREYRGDDGIWAPKSPDDLLAEANFIGNAEYYRENRWTDQASFVELWVEKEALVNIVARVCRERDVPYFACRGYVGASELREAGKRFIGRFAWNSQGTTILYLGDHDPNGIEMTRDIEDRISLFSDGNASVKRIGLTIEQVRRYDPPPNFAKETDSGSTGYIETYGEQSWELDALDPRTLETIIRDAIEAEINQERWEDVVAHERLIRRKLRQYDRRLAKAVEAEKLRISAEGPTDWEADEDGGL